jgi:CheY-like chemotaxis protein
MYSPHVTLLDREGWAAAMGTMINDVAPIRVLLVEDEFLIGEWVAETLAEQGFAVHTVSNAADALRHLASAPVDVLFTDVNLPGGMDGATLARRARDMMPDLAVVYASARMMLDADTRVPGSIFVPKPYVPALVGRLLASTVKSTAECVPA